MISKYNRSIAYTRRISHSGLTRKRASAIVAALFAMYYLLTTLEIVLGILLIACILLQQKGSGLGSAFGGSGAIYSTKRGVEKVVFRATIVLAILFFGLALAHTLFL